MNKKMKVPTDPNTHLVHFYIIWTAIFVSVGIYILMGYFIQPITDIARPAFLLVVFYFFAVAVLPIIFMIRNFLMAPPNTSNPPKGLEFALARYRAAHIASWALAEAIGVFGFMAYMLGYGFSHLLILVMISLAYLVQFRPSRVGLDTFIHLHTIKEGMTQ